MPWEYSLKNTNYPMSIYKCKLCNKNTQVQMQTMQWKYWFRNVIICNKNTQVELKIM
jgi:hypothetical protein